MDAGVSVIARKAQNVLYGVCQAAWIPPPVVEVYSEPIPPVVTPPAIELPKTEVLTMFRTAAEIEAERLAAKGLTYADLDNATDLPPLGDSRRPVQKDDPDDEPASDPAN